MGPDYRIAIILGKSRRIGMILGVPKGLDTLYMENTVKGRIKDDSQVYGLRLGGCQMSINRYMDKQSIVHTTEYYSDIKRNKVLIHATK